jgi:hypothetical protein
VTERRQQVIKRFIGIPSSSQSAASTSPDAYTEQVESYFLRNYVAHVIEGGLYLGGLTFLNAHTVLPAMVQRLGGPSWLVALMPMMMMLGYGWAPLLTAHRVERLYWVKPFVMITGILQRLPFLFAGLALFFFQQSFPAAVVFLVAFSPFITGAIGGLSITAWQELVFRVIPARRRSTSFALRNIMTSAIGIGAGGVIAYVLDNYPGPAGYGILHVLAFVFVMFSLFVLAFVHEARPPYSGAAPRRHLFANLRTIPSMLADNRSLLDYIFVNVLFIGLHIMTPFFAIHAIETLGKGEHFLGFLVTAQMIGGIAGNMLAGYCGDRFGGKLPMLISRILFIIVTIGAMSVETEWGFITLFFVFGMAFYFHRVGHLTMNLEICRPQRRPTYLSTLSIVNFPTMILAAFVSAALKESSTSFFPLALTATLSMAASLLVLLRIPEPRGRYSA